LIPIAVFASGNGSNFEVIAKHFSGNSDFPVKVLIYDKENARCKDIALKNNIPAFHIDYKKYGRNISEEKIKNILNENHIKLSVLAGFMRVLSADFISNAGIPIINIHPSLLPDLKGLNSIERAYNSNSVQTGITIHYVNEKIDAGEIIFQKSVLIDREKPLDFLISEIHRIEHENYPVVIENICRLLSKRHLF
jgi:phosphoribosylglycinamide formyltransferase 1